VSEDSKPSTDVGVSVIRTVTPYLTALIVVELAKRGVTMDSGEVSQAIVPLLGSIWYAVVRSLEVKWPRVGWLLGTPKTPTYEGK